MTALFPLSSEQSELLLEFEQHRTISELGLALSKDPSRISRKLSEVAALAPVLTKSQGRWCLTPLGRKLNHMTREAISNQQSLLNEKIEIKIATTREFASLLLVPELPNLFDLQNTRITVLTTEGETEDRLLSGAADIGLECGKPYSPEVSFSRVLKEPMVAAASPDFISKHEIERSTDLSIPPHVAYERGRQSFSGLIDLNTVLTIQDLSGLRAALLADIGWGIIPRYTVAKELSSGALEELNTWEAPSEQFGVWHLRHRKGLLPIVSKIKQWLQLQRL